MSTELLIIVGILLIGSIVITVVSKLKESKNFDPRGVPHGMEEEYELALNPGSDGKPLMYNLTTCNHCVRVHDFLNQHGIAHHDITVDYFTGKARANIVAKIRSYNPKVSFPTLVFPDGKVVIGYREAMLAEAIGIEPNNSVKK